MIYQATNGLFVHIEKDGTKFVATSANIRPLDGDKDIIKEINDDVIVALVEMGMYMERKSNSGPFRQYFNFERKYYEDNI